MSVKTKFLVKVPCKKGCLYVIYRIEEIEGKITSKELFFTGSRSRMEKVLMGLFDKCFKDREGEADCWLKWSLEREKDVIGKGIVSEDYMLFPF